jgi:NADPH-dependent 2,4-dienoyl-CoA reductase/sulfur reductase-like enzyme
VAASLTQLGVQVSAVYPSKNPLERVLGEQIGTLIAAIHRSHGVRLLAGDELDAVAERMDAARADWLRTECGSAPVRRLG